MIKCNIEDIEISELPVCWHVGLTGDDQGHALFAHTAVGSERIFQLAKVMLVGRRAQSLAKHGSCFIPYFPYS